MPVSEPARIRALVTGNPLALAQAAIGDAWSQLILREAFFGVRRFSDWSSALGIPRSVLSGRLRRLCELGVLRTEIPAGKKRAEYRLTEMGLDLFGSALIQGQWERLHAPSTLQKRYALTFFDAVSGDPIEPCVLDRAGGNPIDPRNVTYRLGHSLMEQVPPPQRLWSSGRSEGGRPMIEKSVEIMGDYWSWSIVGCAFLRLRRFDEMTEATGIAPNILSDRLSRLTDMKILKKIPYQQNPVRHEYRLTSAGLDLHPWIMAMYGWSERWICTKGQPTLTLIRRDNRGRISPVVCNRHTGKPIRAWETRWRMESARPEQRKAAARA